ncbi:MAG: MBOAT family O-acyltransferase [Acidobacteriota bacterium]
MLFVEPRFFLFFAVVLTAYWSLRSNSQRKWLVLAASYFFYGSWDWRFACMLLLISAADYFFALRISQSSSDGLRKLYVTLSLAMNLAVLGFFKYFHFFVGSAVAVAGALHLRLDQPTIKIILPVGVSFFTFQSLSYTIDVYRGEIPPAPSLRDYLTFAAFFPQLVAGPIVRPKYFLPQLQSCRTISVGDVKQMLYLFLLGYIKKACIADNISPMVDRYFQHPAGFNHVSAITAVWLYATQIFCDFSGYSDMAIAAAGLMGYKLVLNFDAPYLAVSIQEFWKRWHISLSSWIRDYIYISLGGNRGKTRAFKYRNLLLTMLAGGLWHGAAWTFVAWGGSHGAAQVIHAEFNHQLPVKPHHEPLRKVLGWFLTLQFVCIVWILFRSTSFSEAGFVTRQYFGLAANGLDAFPLWLLWLPPVLLLGQALMRRTQIGERLCATSLQRFAIVYGAAWALAIALLPLGYRPFIYFQF